MIVKYVAINMALWESRTCNQSPGLHPRDSWQCRAPGEGQEVGAQELRADALPHRRRGGTVHESHAEHTGLRPGHRPDQGAWATGFLALSSDPAAPSH